MSHPRIVIHWRTELLICRLGNTMALVSRGRACHARRRRLLKTWDASLSPALKTLGIE